MTTFSPAKKIALVAAALAGTGSVLVALSSDEGKSNKSYVDNVGVATECYGHTRGVVLGTTKTDAQCMALLKEDATDHGLGIAYCLQREPPLESFRAFMRLGFNIGTPAFCTSTVARRTNEGDIKGACDAMLLWNRGRAKNPKRDCIGPVDAKGKCAIRGLDNRRHDERAQCLKGLETK